MQSVNELSIIHWAPHEFPTQWRFKIPFMTFSIFISYGLILIKTFLSGDARLKINELKPQVTGEELNVSTPCHYLGHPFVAR